MASTNQRQAPRTPVTLRIKFKSETVDQFIERYSVDISQGGIFIRTKKPLAVGTALSFEFQLKDSSPLITGEGTVVWIREEAASSAEAAPGMGVRFDRLPPESEDLLARVLDEKKARSSGPGGRAPSSPGGSRPPTPRPNSEPAEASPFGESATRVAPGDLLKSLDESAGGEDGAGALESATPVAPAELADDVLSSAPASAHADAVSDGLDELSGTSGLDALTGSGASSVLPLRPQGKGQTSRSPSEPRASAHAPGRPSTPFPLGADAEDFGDFGDGASEQATRIASYSEGDLEGLKEGAASLDHGAEAGGAAAAAARPAGAQAIGRVSSADLEPAAPGGGGPLVSTAHDQDDDEEDNLDELPTGSLSQDEIAALIDSPAARVDEIGERVDSAPWPAHDESIGGEASRANRAGDQAGEGPQADGGAAAPAAIAEKAAIGEGAGGEAGADAAAHRLEVGPGAEVADAGEGVARSSVGSKAAMERARVLAQKTYVGGRRRRRAVVVAGLAAVVLGGGGLAVVVAGGAGGVLGAGDGEESERESAAAGEMPASGAAEVAPIEVQVEPEGAEVELLDEGEAAEAPARFEGLDPDRAYRVRVSHPDYRVETFRASPGEVAVVTLEPPPVVLAIDSDPPGAMVSIDGEEQGEAPVEIELAGELAEGARYEVELAAEGFRSATETVAGSDFERVGDRYVYEVEATLARARQPQRRRPAPQPDPEPDPEPEPTGGPAAGGAPDDGGEEEDEDSEPAVEILTPGSHDDAAGGDE